MQPDEKLVVVDNSKDQVVVTPKDRIKSITHWGNIAFIFTILFGSDEIVKLICDFLNEAFDPKIAVISVKVIGVAAGIFNIYRREVTFTPIKGSAGEQQANFPIGN